jgi:hypothetical protein
VSKSLPALLDTVRWTAPSPLLESELTSLLPQVAAEESASSASIPAAKEVTPEDKKEADAAKSKGNQLMAKKDYPGAIEAYGVAIEKDGTNAVFWSNRCVPSLPLSPSFPCPLGAHLSDDHL